MIEDWIISDDPRQAVVEVGLGGQNPRSQALAGTMEQRRDLDSLITCTSRYTDNTRAHAAGWVSYTTTLD